MHQHGGHRLSTRALATSAYLQYISCLAWDDVRIYLLGYPDTSLAEPETPQLVRWVVEAGVSTLPSWIEHARERNCGDLLPSEDILRIEDCAETAFELVMRCRRAYGRAEEGEDSEGEMRVTSS